MCGCATGRYSSTMPYCSHARRRQARARPVQAGAVRGRAGAAIPGRRSAPRNPLRAPGGPGRRRASWFCGLRAAEQQTNLERARPRIVGPLQRIIEYDRMLREFSGYIDANRAFIPNYGDRWRNGEAISTAFVESAVNQIISWRFVKKQQMRWTERGSHHLLQIRTRSTTNGERRWRAG